MKILVELPELMEDTVFITPAIENLLKHYKNAQVTFVGSDVSTQLFAKDDRISDLIVEDTSKSIFTLISLFRLAKSFDEQDLLVSFKNSFLAKFFVYFVDAKKKMIFNMEDIKNSHKVEVYNDFMNKVLDTSYKAGDLMLRFKPKWYKKTTFGIHPGSTYADVKRMPAKEFAKIAVALSVKYDIVLLGGKNEIDACAIMEEELKANGISNYENLAGKTSVPQLIEKIAPLDLFLGIDCGPIQIAAVYRVNSMIIPTSYENINIRNQ
ncbi:MAG: glycosyltransferase family 9 protein, partial [Campylobacterota bacterium]